MNNGMDTFSWVMQDRKKELSDAIAGWSAQQASRASPAKGPAPSKAPANAETASSAEANLLGKKPPCKSFETLKTKVEFHNLLDTFYECSDKASLLEAAEELKPIKTALSELNTNVKAYISDVVKVLNAAKANKDALKRPAGVPMSNPAARRQRPNSNLFDIVSGLPSSKAVPTHSISASEPMHLEFDKPFLIRLGEEHASVSPQNPAKQFAELWVQNRRKSTLTRAAKIVDLASPEQAWGTGFPKSTLTLDGIELATMSGSQDLDAKVFACSAYWIMKGFSGVSNEKNHMSCFRIMYQGSRALVCARFLDVDGYMKEAGINDRCTMAVWYYFHKSNMDLAGKLCEKFPVFYGTLAANEMLYLPPGLVVSEHVGTDKDAIGFRIPALVKGSAVVTEFEKVKEWLAGQPNTQAIRYHHKHHRHRCHYHDGHFYGEHYDRDYHNCHDHHHDHRHHHRRHRHHHHQRWGHGNRHRPHHHQHHYHRHHQQHHQQEAIAVADSLIKVATATPPST